MDDEQIQSSEVVVTDNMLNSMRSTKPWTMFLSVLGFISVAFMVIIGLIIIVAGKFFPDTVNTYFTAGLGVFYIIAAAVYLIPLIYLFKYSSAIRRFLVSKKGFDMESALANQKSFWKFIGIFCLIMIILSIIGVIAAIIIGAFFGSKI